MPRAEPHGECANCRRMRPYSLLNNEGRCESCGLRETVPAAADPSHVGPHGEQEKKGGSGKSANPAAAKDSGPTVEGTDTLGDKLGGKGELE